ncbi:MAG: response regulator [Deltaproteobacteria bacterium]|nr:response regulator [Deltaproteobacteria bacterium]
MRIGASCGMKDDNYRLKVVILGDRQECVSISGIFEGRPCDLHLATYGDEDALKSIAEIEPALILVCSSFRDLDASEICGRIRSINQCLRPVVIVTSPVFSEEIMINALKGGADDFIILPVDSRVLLARIDAHLKTRKFSVDMALDKRNIETVLDITKAVSSTLDARSVLSTIVCKIAEITGAKRCSILLVAGNTGYVLASNDSPEMQELKIDLARYPEVLEAIKIRKHLMVEDMPNHPMMAEIKGLISNLEGMSVLVVPITFGEDVIGTLFLRAQKQVFGEKEIELCRIAANASYPALRNARLYENLKEEKERLLQERIDDLAKSRAELVATNEALNKEIAERRRAEESIRVHEQMISSIIDNSTAIISVKDAGARYQLVNRKFEEIYRLDIEKLKGKTDHDIFPKNTADTLRSDDLKVLASKAPIALERVIELDDGPHTYLITKFPLYDPSGEILSVCSMSTDITAHKCLEKELMKAQKLESIGVLAGGIAHDFNNILTGILANISLLSECMDRADKNYRWLREVEKATFRARELTHQLLTFSKGGKPVKESVHIGKLLEEWARFASRGSKTKCLFSIPEDLWPIEVDAGQISQVINNLVINAEQAMPDGGEIKVSAENTVLNAEERLPLGNGRYVKISIEDKGVGIQEEFLHKIFDPYFTTKQTGSGLGLYSAYSIIKNHNGYIGVESRIGAGTAFDIYLPASERNAEIRDDGSGSLIRGKGKILVVDDEEIIRNVIGAILTFTGYKAEFVAEGKQAIETYRKAQKSAEPFDAVIIDLTIPGGMGGRETIKGLLDLDSKVKAIVSSGYNNDPIMADYSKYGFKGAVRKPFSALELSKALHKIISEED